MGTNLNAKVSIRNGIIGSLAGGIVFGMMMSMMGMMGMVAKLVGSESVLVGWGVHMVISLAFGVAFGGILTKVAWNRLVLGASWGVAAWVGGALILMPILLGMPGMVFDLSGATPWWSLVGHMVYGLVAGGTVIAIERRVAEPVPAPVTG